MARYIGVVVVTPKTDKLHPLDENVPGRYPFTMEAEDETEAEKKILDRFHETIPVKTLDDFDFPVKEVKALVKPYTIVAVYHATFQRFCTGVNAKDPKDAEEKAQEACRTLNGYDEDSGDLLIIAGVLEGEHQVVDTEALKRAANHERASAFEDAINQGKTEG